MSRLAWSPRRLAALAPVALFVGMLPLFSGCGGDDQKPVTAETSKFAVADGSGDSPAPGDPAADANGAAGETQGGASAGAAPTEDGTPSKPPSRPPMTPDRRQPGAPAGDVEPGDDGLPPRSNGKGRTTARLTPETIPEGTADEMLALLGELEQQGPQGRTNRELLENIQQWLKTRLVITDKVLAGETTDKPTEKQRLRAAQTKRETLLQMIQAGVPEVDQQMVEFTKAMKADPAPQLARLGLLTDLQLNLAMVMSGAKQETGPLEGALNAVLALDPADDEVFQAAVAAAVTLQQAGLNDVALPAYQAIQQRFADSKNERIQTILGQVRELAKFIEVKFDALRQAVMTGEADSIPPLLAAVDSLLADKPGPAVLERLSQAAQELEYSRHYEVAGKIYSALDAAFKNHPDAEVAQMAAQQVTSGQRRAGLVGQPFIVEGRTLDGQEFDWKPYEGKIVLVDFWATWCAPCRAELPNIKRNYDRYHEQGFEVVGINLDKERTDVEQFFSVQKLPWATVVEANALADKCGVESIPFVVLVGRDGRVIDLHVRGELLGRRLAEIFDGAKPGDEKPAEKTTDEPTEKPTEKPAEDATEKPAEKPADAAPEKPADEQSNAGASRRVRRAQVAGESNVRASLLAADEPAAPAPQPAPRSSGGRRVSAGSAAPVPTARPAEDAAPADAPAEPAVNPYLARNGLKPAELIDYLLNMQEKPKSIQSRVGFTEAIVDAADRVLAAETTDKFRGIAAEIKIDALHKKASFGDLQADKQLDAFVDTLTAKPIPAVDGWVKLLLLERKVNRSADLAADVAAQQIPALLDEIKQYCGQETLSGRHLRLASSTVAAINRIEDGDVREKQFAEFGKLFAKSADKELARYGKKLAKTPSTSVIDFLDKPLEIAGETASGAPFDWATYRGKVVIVDFWATWCGPCIKELPNVKATYEKYKDRGFDIVGVSLDQDQEALAEFLEKNALPWTTLAGDGTQELAQKYQVRGIPTVMLVDQHGNVVKVAHRVDQLIPDLEKLLDAKPEAKPEAKPDAKPEAK